MKSKLTALTNKKPSIIEAPTTNANTTAIEDEYSLDAADNEQNFNDSKDEENPTSKGLPIKEGKGDNAEKMSKAMMKVKNQ